MKTLISSICLLSLGSLFLVSESDAATYAGQACESRSAGLGLTYTSYGATNNNSSTIYITCPATRIRDDSTAAVSSSIYFVNDGRSKTCYFENFNINTGGVGLWAGKTEARRLEFSLPATLRWYPYTFNCTLPAGSRVNGYHVGE
jgi:hypothetical protein